MFKPKEVVPSKPILKKETNMKKERHNLLLIFFGSQFGVFDIAQMKW